MTELEEAADPRTRAARLAELARAPDPAIQSLVARNPKTSVATLGWLAVMHPRGVCAHRALLTSGQKSFRAWSSEAWLAMAAEPGCPERVVALAAERFPALLVVLLRPDVTDTLRTRAEVSFRGEVLTASMRAQVARVAPPGDAEALLRGRAASQMAALCAPGLRVEQLQRLAATVLPTLAYAVARHPLATAAIGEQLLKRVGLVEGVLEIPGLPVAVLLDADPQRRSGHVLRYLLERGEGADRWLDGWLLHAPTNSYDAGQAIARTLRDAAGASPPPGLDGVLQAWATHPELSVRLEVAKHRGPLGDVVLDALVGDHMRVKQEVAARPDLGETRARRLLSDHDPLVRFALARNESLPWSVVEPLWQDGSAMVRSACRRRPDVPSHRRLDLTGASVDDLIDLLGQDDLPSALVEQLLHHEHRWVSVRAARHKSLRPADYLPIVYHPFWEVREAIAAAKGTPASALALLVADPEDRVRERLAGHPILDPSLRDRLALDPAPLVRRAVAKSRHATAAQRAWLAEDEHPEIRAAALASRRV